MFWPATPHRPNQLQGSFYRRRISEQKVTFCPNNSPSSVLLFCARFDDNDGRGEIDEVDGQWDDYLNVPTQPVTNFVHRLGQIVGHYCIAIPRSITRARWEGVHSSIPSTKLYTSRRCLGPSDVVAKRGKDGDTGHNPVPYAVGLEKVPGAVAYDGDHSVERLPVVGISSPPVYLIVIKENAELAFSWVKSHSTRLQIPDAMVDVHFFPPISVPQRENGTRLTCWWRQEKVLGVCRARREQGAPQADHRGVEHDFPKEVRECMEFVFSAEVCTCQVHFSYSTLPLFLLPFMRCRENHWTGGTIADRVTYKTGKLDSTGCLYWQHNLVKSLILAIVRNINIQSGYRGTKSRQKAPLSNIAGLQPSRLMPCGDERWTEGIADKASTRSGRILDQELNGHVRVHLHLRMQMADIGTDWDDLGAGKGAGQKEVALRQFRRWAGSRRWCTVQPRQDGTTVQERLRVGV
ncbi:hypothetical protein H4582DRAFT_2059419 [Lactarius indigo]|nr:hypothetical protein H4582DRAFT_2059419 [Lactarius indigo]